MMRRINTFTTISRTWTSGGLATPEWLNQVRRTDRAGDVTIDVEPEPSADVGVPTIDTGDTAAEVVLPEPVGEKKRSQTVAFDLPSGTPSRTPSSAMMTPALGEGSSSDSPALSVETRLPSHLSNSVINSPTGSVVDVPISASDKKRSHPSVVFDLGSRPVSRAASPTMEAAPDVGSDRSSGGEDRANGETRVKDHKLSRRRNAAERTSSQASDVNDQEIAVGNEPVHGEVGDQTIRL